MPTRPLHVLVLVGGQSPEHPISLRSAATVLEALKETPHRATVVAIARDGTWVYDDFSQIIESARDEIVEIDVGPGRAVTLGYDGSSTRLVALGPKKTLDALDPIDLALPILHGPFGEDGKVQGLLEMMHLPFVGAKTTASALAMDKLAMKTLAAGAGIAQVEFLDGTGADDDDMDAAVRADFGYPVFVKPANLGSAIGVSKASDKAELVAALALARSYDHRVLVERAVEGREIEIGVLGSDPVELSPPGEIVTSDTFYDFDSKYVLDNTGLLAPTQLDAVTLETVEQIARKVWKLIDGSGMARIDFFVDKNTGTVLLNEINTIPGFTAISMYPRLWAAAGLNTTALLERLIELALKTA